MRPRARLIYNPTSGQETISRSVADILHILERAGYEASTHRTSARAKSAQREATRCAKEGFDLLVAAGGDGTINEVINGIAALPQRPKLAVIPAGTTNDYARALRIPRDNFADAAKVVLKGQMIQADIGQAGDQYFMNIAGGGSLTELTYDVSSEYKSVLGYLAYLLKGAEMLPRIRPMKARVEYDDGVYEGDVSMFLLGLTNSIGGFEQIAPDAALDDGNFSLILVKSVNPAEIIRLLTLALNGGRHVNDPKILYTKTKKLVVSSLQKDLIKINLDGEFGGTAPMTFINLPRHLNIFANVADMPASALVGNPLFGLPVKK